LTRPAPGLLLFHMEVLHKRPGVVARARAPRQPFASKKERELPPQVPDDLAAIDEALTLLGNLVQCLQSAGRFRESVRLRLLELVGGVPDLATAKAWKTGLKELRAELAALEQRS
jgi:hypothetical protein